MKNKLLSGLILLGCTALSFGNPLVTKKTVLGNSLCKPAISYTAKAALLIPEIPEALSAVNVRNTMYGAQWTSAPGATGYLLDVSTTPFSLEGEIDDAAYLYKDLNVGNVVFYTVTNLNADTPYYYRVRATDGETVSGYSNTVSVITTSVSTWNGAMWSDNEPNAAINAILNGAFDTAENGVFTARTLTINQNGSMKVASGTNFTVLHGITNNSTAAAFLLENNANLLQTGTFNENSGSITVKRDATMKRLDYIYWSAPVEGQNLKDFSAMTVQNRFYELEETSNTFVYVNPTANSFIPAKGYSIRAPNNFPETSQTFSGTFTGKPNSGTINTTLYHNGNGFNLIGNPFPSTISTDLFLAGNPDINTLYFFTHTVSGPTNGGNYATYNSTGQIEASATGSEIPNETIQTGQGFVAQVNQESEAVFLNSMRVANNENQFFREALPEKHRIWLNLSNASGRVNQILVGYVEGATNGIDNQFDGKSMTTMTTGLSSLTPDNSSFVIQGKSLPFTENDMVKLSFQSTSPGVFTISSGKYDGVFAAGQDFYIKDNSNGTVTNLKVGAYSFATEAGTFNDRFEMVYQNNILGVAPVSGTENSVVVYKENGILKIDSGTAVMTAAKVYDIAGRLLSEMTGINGSSISLTGLTQSNSALIIRVVTTDGNSIIKKTIY